MKLYGLIGFPLSHSFSKTYFEQKFLEEGISNCGFKNFELSHIEQLEQVIQEHAALEGFAITIPHKKNILPYLHWMSAEVQQMQACNCVKIVGGKLYGFNTDILGFEQSLKQQLQPHHTQALLLGSGGAANAVAFVLNKMGIPFYVVSRSKNEHERTITYADLTKELIAEHRLIINATPLGTYPNIEAYPPIPYQYLTAKHYLFDLVYNPSITKFLSMGIAAGATTKNGYDMLTIQAEENWKIWNTNLANEQ